MKKILQIIIALLIVKQSTAQTKFFSYGIKAGLSVGKIAILPPLQNRSEHYGVGFVAGGVTQFAIAKKLKIQIEPLYILNNSSLKFNPSPGDVNEIDLSLHQISLPVQISYSIIPTVSLNAGVSGNYNFYFSQKVMRDFGANPSFNITDEIVKFQSGLLGGVTFYSKNIFIDARYNRMLGNLFIQQSEYDQTEYHLVNFQLSVGYRF